MNSIGAVAGGKHAHFQGGKCAPRIAVAGFGQELEGVVVHADLMLSQPAIFIGNGPQQQGFDLIVRKRLELKDPAAAD